MPHLKGRLQCKRPVSEPHRKNKWLELLTEASTQDGPEEEITQ